MNSFSRFLWSLFLPRLPRFGPDDVAGTAEYYNRLARHDEASMNPPREWRGRISMQLTLHMQRFKTAEKVSQKILRHAAQQQSCGATAGH
jgi:hypothetical protein